jgi:protein-S-isoprenylcysteine O-methyltransferase Ste14
MDLQHGLLVFYWVLFCGLHSVLASLWWKRLAQRIMDGSFRFYRLFYTVFAFVSLGFVIYYQVQIASPRLLEQRLFWIISGSAIMFAGVVVMAICIKKYFMSLSGLKSLYLNDEQAANQLQVSGIHRFVRHPLYSGTFLAIWGLWLLVPQLSLLLANGVITIYTLLAISWEEKKLEAEFGDSYRRYKKQVPKLLPLPGRTSR